jgi:2-oxoglutarate ferredoxin oxidoreductase subunit delta
MKFWRKPLDHDKYSSPKGEIHIIDDRCKGCRFCVEFCPTEVLAESERYNSKGYHPPEIKFEEKCIGCRLCELICPEFAVYVILPENTENKNRKKEKSSIEKEPLEVSKNG